MNYTGTINGAANPEYPSAVANALYLVTAAGRIGGALGRTINEGDVVKCLSTNSGGSQEAVGTDWTVIPATADSKLAAEVSRTPMPAIDVDQATIDALLMAATRVGVATVPGGVTTVNIATAAAKATSAILITPRVASTTQPFVSDIVDGTSFMINGDPGVYSWMIQDPQA